MTNRPATAQFPLHPGRPLVYRCRRCGVWGFRCDCLDQSPTGQFGTEHPNRANWADAMRKAHSHARSGHNSPTTSRLKPPAA